MIVICTKCQAKFRVADEKIGPRGAKVRCSKCQTVFVVYPEPPAAAPAIVPAPSADNPFATNPVRSQPGPSLDGLSAPAPADPFGAPSSAVSPAPRGADPFAVSPSARDPFGAAAPGLAPMPDPFAAAGERSTLPVTDLSDLLGTAAGGAATPPAPVAAVPPPLPPPLPSARPRAPAAAPEPAQREAALGGGEPQGEGGLSLDAPAAAPEAGSLELPPLDAPTPTPGTGGLSLEDRFTPPPMKVPGGSPELGGLGPGADPFAGQAGSAAFDAANFDYGGEFGDELGLAGESPPGAAAPSGAAAPPEHAAPAPAAPFAAALPEAAPAPAVAPARAAEPAPERIPGQRSSRLRSAAVNAVALVALLVVALAILVVWRTEGPLEVSALRPSNVLRVLGRGDRAAGPFAPRDLLSGRYERERAAPLLFVRGSVVSRAAAPAGRVRVTVEVVRGGQVLARGEALAGGVPTPEELYRAADAAALAGVARAAAARAPAAVRPGETLPFLVAIGDVPADLDGASLSVWAAEGTASP